MKFPSFCRGAIIAAIFALVSTAAFAQGIITGSIAGTIVDQSGAVLPSAAVVASRADTNGKYTVTTASDGTFSIKDMQVGTYVLAVTAPGFSTLTVNNVLVDSNRVNAIGKKALIAGGSSVTVEVSAASSLLETTASQVTTTFTAEALTSLPTGGGFDELALLIPGVVSTHANNFSNTNGVGFSVNGLRGRSNNFELDGQSNNDNSVAGPQFFFSNDEALAEIQIITNDFAAQYGRNAGAIVNYVTKSGTNQIHGSAIYRYSGNFTSSLATGVSKGPQFGFCGKGENPSDGCTVPVVPRYVNNIYGGTLGGPIIKDKLFAFASTYWYKLYEYGALTSSGTSLFPTQAGLATLASTYSGSPAVAILQQLSPYSITSGNPRQTSTSVTNRTVTNGTTAVTIPFAQFGRQIPSSNLDQEHLGRLDYQATPKDRFFARYAYQLNPTSPYSPVAAGGYANVTGTTHSIGADWAHTFSSRVLSQLRYSFQQSKLAFDGGGFPNCTITSFLTCPSSISLGSGTTSLGLASGFPQGRIVKVGQVQSNTTWTLGRHNLTFGGEFDYQNSPNVFLPNQSGAFTFSSFSNFLQGVGSVNLTNGSPTVPFKENDVAVYFQDDWKVSSQLTINMGLRWEFFQQAINLLHDKTVAQQTGSNPFWNTSLPLSRTTFPSIPQSYRNFEPRLGFAFNPEFARKLVIRGGYAINVDPGFYNINLNSATSAPVVNAGTISCNSTTGISCLPTGGATYSTVTAQYLKYIPTGVDPGTRNQTLVGSNFRQPMTQTYTLATQYQIQNAAVIEVRYTGNHVAGNFQTLDGNPYLLPVATDFPNVVSPSSLCTAATSTLTGGGDIGRLHCGTTNVRLRANTSFSNYNSLQANLTTRAFHGVTGTMAFTHSHTIDNTSEIFGTLGGGNTSAFAANPLDPNVNERATSGIDFPNTASAGLTYAFPNFVVGHGLFSRFTNGWTANTVWLYNSGQPFTDFDYYQSQSPAANYGDVNSYMSYANSKEIVAYNSGYDFARPLLSNSAAPVGTIGIYTTTAASPTVPVLLDYSTGNPVSPSAVHFITNNRWAAKLAGNPYAGVSRNTLRGNTFNNVDVRVSKSTKITERVNLKFEVDAFNVLNRSYYGTPDNYIGDAPFGSFNNFLFTSAGGSNIGTGTGVRNMQFGAKILF